jgi:phage N-6-adenine-methyltransferase
MRERGTTVACSTIAQTHRRRKVDQSWFNAKSVEYGTPDSIYEPLNREFGFTLDVASTHENAKCANHYTSADDGLKQEWSGVCWMNPPYGRVMQKWVRKAHREYLRGCTVVALIPARTNTGWWHECVQDIATVRFIRGEVAFKGFDRGLWMPMCVVIWPHKTEAGPAWPEAEAARDLRDLRLLSGEIRAALRGRATGIWDSLPGVEDTFYEGCYALCAAQNPAVRTAEAVRRMRAADMYGRLPPSGEAARTVIGDVTPRAELAGIMRGLVRFHNVKSGRVAAFRGQVAGIHAVLAATSDFIRHSPMSEWTPSLRDWLAREVDGFGFKEASHFLRNVGFRGLTIPDIHVLRRLAELGLVKEPSGSPTPKAHREADAAMRRYAEAIGADLDELDVLWWSRGSGGFGR